MSDISSDELATDEYVEGRDGDRMVPLRSLVEVRDAMKREQRRRAELEPLLVENADLRRRLGLAQAGIRADSATGELVLAAAAYGDVDEPDDVAAMARAMWAESPNNGGRGRQDQE